MEIIEKEIIKITPIKISDWVKKDDLTFEKIVQKETTSLDKLNDELANVNEQLIEANKMPDKITINNDLKESLIGEFEFEKQKLESLIAELEVL